MKGYTLVELLLSITLIGMIATFSVPVFQSTLFRSQLDSTTSTVVSTLRKAQSYARSQKEDSNWGISFASSDLVLYKGDSYLTRDTSYDETYTLNGTVISGISEINFGKLTGFPSSSGNIVITGKEKVRIININEKGTLTF